MYRVDCKDLDIIGERFESYGELKRVVEGRKINGAHSATDLTHKIFPDGHDMVDFAKTWERILGESDTHRKDLDRAMGEIEDEMGDHWSEQDRPRRTFSAVGTSVSVGRHLAGHPESLIRRRESRVPAKAVRILFDTDVTEEVTPEMRVRSGALAIMAVRALEARGHSVELGILHCAAFSGWSDKRGHVLEVTAKGFGCSTVPERIAYLACSMSALFHVGCWWLHRFADASPFHAGWGRSLSGVEYGRERMREYARRRGGIYLASNTMMYDLKLDPFLVLRYVDDGLEAIYGKGR